MNKRDMIDSIRRINPTAEADFLATFHPTDLLAYLHQLQEVERERQELALYGRAEHLMLATA
jgi:hypothetical protein